MYVVASGDVEIRRKVGEIERVLAVIPPGDFFGEMAILSDTVRSADVVASSAMTAMVMTDSQFRSLARRMPDVAEKIREACRTRTREMQA
jgi:CRP-like cAMP-binding protein